MNTKGSKGKWHEKTRYKGHDIADNRADSGLPELLDPSS